MQRVAIERCVKGDSLVPLEREMRREHRDRSFDAIARAATQLDEIVGTCDGNDEQAVVANDTSELDRVEARSNRENDIERRFGVRNEAIGIGDDPFVTRIAACGRFDRRNGDVNAA